jgi:hypothetical protein
LRSACRGQTAIGSANQKGNNKPPRGPAPLKVDIVRDYRHRPVSTKGKRKIESYLNWVNLRRSNEAVRSSRITASNKQTNSHPNSAFKPLKKKKNSLVKTNQSILLVDYSLEK